jgi:hypothetical protein
MTGTIAILSTASVAIVSLMVLSCLVLAGRADRKMREFAGCNLDPETPKAC